MMSGRPGRVPLQFLPDEARNLPPPKLTDPRLVYIGFLGYCSGLLDNAINRRPVLLAGEGCASGIRGGGERVSGFVIGGQRCLRFSGHFRLAGLASPSWGIRPPPPPVSSSELGGARVSFGFLGN